MKRREKKRNIIVNINWSLNPEKCNKLPILLCDAVLPSLLCADMHK